MPKKMQSWKSRPLEGWVVGISVANSEDMAAHGYSTDDTNRATIRVSEALLGAGARLVFGHDWRPDGIMEAICRIAVNFQPPIQNSGTPLPLIQNFLSWPAKPSLDYETRRDLEQRGVLKIQTVELPECEMKSSSNPVDRAIGLSYLRRELVNRTNARVCLGGRVQTAQGFFAGVIEEAYHAAKAGHPVFVGHFLGGAAAELVEALEDPSQPKPALRVLTKMEAAFKPIRTAECDVVSETDLSPAFSPVDMQVRSGLSPEDWKLLLNAHDVEAFSTLVLRGLSRAKNPSAVVEPDPPEASPASQHDSPAPKKSKRRK